LLIGLAQAPLDWNSLIMAPSWARSMKRDMSAAPNFSV
jgi:hypothetical protein